MVKEMSKNIAEIHRKGSSAPGVRQGVALGNMTKKESLGWTEVC